MNDNDLRPGKTTRLLAFTSFIEANEQKWNGGEKNENIGNGFV